MKKTKLSNIFPNTKVAAYYDKALAGHPNFKIPYRDPTSRVRRFECAGFDTAEALAGTACYCRVKAFCGKLRPWSAP